MKQVSRSMPQNHLLYIIICLLEKNITAAPNPKDFRVITYILHTKIYQDTPRSKENSVPHFFLFPDDYSLAVQVNYTFCPVVESNEILLSSSVASTVIETVNCADGILCSVLYQHCFLAIESTCVCVFSIEYIARFYASNNR